MGHLLVDDLLSCGLSDNNLPLPRERAQSLRYLVPLGVYVCIELCSELMPFLEQTSVLAMLSQ